MYLSQELTFLVLLVQIVKTEDRNCSFITFGNYEHGVCTFYGACRIENRDYMNQGGCAEQSQWSTKLITKKDAQCKIWKRDESKISFGNCNSDGLCSVKNSTFSRYSPDCLLHQMFEAKNLKENLTIATTLPIYKDSRLKNPKVRTQFLGQVYNFLGGLGNALTYAGKLKWEL